MKVCKMCAKELSSTLKMFCNTKCKESFYSKQYHEQHPKIKRHCNQCAKEIPINSRKKVFCSTECHRLFYRQKRKDKNLSEKKKLDRKCAHCKKSIPAKLRNYRFCSHICKSRYANTMTRKRHPDKVRKSNLKYFHENPEKMAGWRAKWKKNNPEWKERSKEYSKEYRKREVSIEYSKSRCRDLKDSYILQRMGLKAKDTPPELIDLKRALLKGKRLIRQQQGV